MDSDIFFDDSEIDLREYEKRLAENEIRRKQKELWDKGYLDGLEWAEVNYKNLQLENTQLDLFRQGLMIGQEQSHQDRLLFQEAGALNAYMLLADHKQLLFESEKQEIKGMMEKLNIQMSQDQIHEIDQKILEDSKELRERMDKKMQSKQ